VNRESSSQQNQLMVKLSTMKMCVGVEIQTYAFLTSALDGGK
jgi:hypothetical protein